MRCDRATLGPEEPRYIARDEGSNQPVEADRQLGLERSSQALPGAVEEIEPAWLGLGQKLLGMSTTRIIPPLASARHRVANPGSSARIAVMI